MQLKFFWRDEPIDVLEVPALDAGISAYISVSAPLQLARATPDVIAKELVILDGAGGKYTLAVEPTEHRSERFPAINGYVTRSRP